VLARETTGTDGPLRGVRVVELGVILAGPFVGKMLGDFGAEVIKVEAPGVGDPMRDWGATRADGPNGPRALWWPFLARNKKLITLDLRQPDGQELARRLIDECDVLVENFKPGTLERWGLSPEVLLARNPRLIVARVSGYGQTGPYAHRPGYASAGEAAGGLRYLNGFPDQPPPRMGLSMGDSLAGMFAFQGVLLALYNRAANGGAGQVIDVGITDACLAVSESVTTEFAKLGAIRQPQGVRLAHVVPSNLYTTRDGRRVVIAANSDSLWQRLCKVMGRADLAENPLYADDPGRRNHADALDAEIMQWTATLDFDDLARRLDEGDVVFGPVNSAEDLVNDPHFRANRSLITMTDPELGDLVGPGVIPRLSETPGHAHHTGHWALGHDNDDVYGALLGLSTEERRALADRGVI
jgi:crotonobetainyl-CoA:carnitine CoA-transferase CaiB-like acyl-CoA transferase